MASAICSPEIAYLRSLIVHHPDPNPNALRDFAEARSHLVCPKLSSRCGETSFNPASVDPVARNLRGAKLASDLIVEALTKPTLTLSRAVKEK